MATSERVKDRAARRHRRLLTTLGTELREARIAAGLSQARVARASGLSQASVSRTERIRRKTLTLQEASAHAEALGLNLSVKAYPTGSPVRDAAQLRLLGRFRRQLSDRYRWRTEVPVAGPGDARAWDARLDGPVSIGIEGETRLHDIQATQRRVELKHRDGTVEFVVLVVADTAHNRRVIREHRAALGSTFPADTGEVLRALRSGTGLRRSGIVIL